MITLQKIKDILSKQTKPNIVEHVILGIFIFNLLQRIRKENGGFKKYFGSLIYKLIQSNSGLQKKLNDQFESEAKEAILGIFKDKPKPQQFTIPLKGLDEKDLFNILEERSKQDVIPSEGRNWAYIYATNKKHKDIVNKAYQMFIDKNALNGIQFISLRNFEIELVSMGANMLHGPQESVGQMTSCGTESLLMMMKCYRDYGKSKNLSSRIKPEVVVCSTTHPGVYKAAHYFQMKLIVLQQDENLQFPWQQLRKAINKNTVLIVASAPQYSNGVIDNIVEIGQIAKKLSIPLHVDACIGGFALPWIEKAGFEVPLWDFRVEGVTSISADIHKYGFSAKGSSLLIYRSDEYRRFQYFSLCKWAGGIYISPNMTGTRGGGPFAGAWASLMYLGEEGFIEIFKNLMEVVNFFKKEIANIPGLKLLGKTYGPLLSFTSEDINIFNLADEMDEMGWFMERNSSPPSLHLTVMPQHQRSAHQFISDLRKASELVRKNPLKYQGKDNSAAVYGMIAKIPDQLILDDYMSFVLAWMYKRHD